MDGVNRTDRLYAIAEELRRAGPGGRTAARLARHLEVSTRTVKRDVAALQQAGLPVWAQPGPGGGYVLDARASLPPVTFTPAQAVAVAVALTALPPGSPFGSDGAAALGKLVDTLGPQAQQRARALAGRVWVSGARPAATAGEAAREGVAANAREGPDDGRAEGTADAPATRADGAVLHAVERALAEERVLVITYRAGHGGSTRRSVEPVLLAWNRGCWYLAAWCRLRDGVRWFRLERIERADITTERYEPRDPAVVGEPPPGATPARGFA